MDELTVTNFSTYYNTTNWTTLLDYSMPFYPQANSNTYPSLFAFNQAVTIAAGTYNGRTVPASNNSWFMRGHSFAGTVVDFQSFKSAVVTTSGTTQGGVTSGGITVTNDRIQQVGASISTLNETVFANGANNTNVAASAPPTTGSLNTLSIGPTWSSGDQWAYPYDNGMHVKKFVYRNRTLAAASANTLTSAYAPSATYSTISATGPTLADGVTTSTVTITLKGTNNLPLPGYTPTFSATGGVGNVTGTCTVTNTSGVSTCTLTSTSTGVKTLSITSPAGLGAVTNTATFN